MGLISEMQRDIALNATKQKDDLILNAAMIVFDEVKAIDDLLPFCGGYTDAHGCEIYAYKGTPFIAINPPEHTSIDNQFTVSFKYEIIR